MISSASFARAAGAALALLAIFQAGCAIPFGPGFGHPARGIELQALPAAQSTAPAGGVRVHVTDRLVNTGDRDLDFLDLDLPAEALQAADHVKISVDGRDVAASANPDAPVRVRFEPPWKEKQSRTIVIDYDLPPQFSSEGVVGATRDAFYLADRTAWPIWRAPSGLLATAARYSRTRTIAVTLPSQFRVLAPLGKERAVRESAGLLRWELRVPKPDEQAYLIAGAYAERRVEVTERLPPGVSREVNFWTFEPLDAAAARQAANRLAATAGTFQETFGDLHRRVRPLYVIDVEAPAISASPSETYQGIAAASFPSGVLLDRGAVASGITSEAVLEAAEYELARSWFGWRAEPDSASRILLGRGISLFAVALAAEARGGATARQQQVENLLQAYDQIRRKAADDPLLQAPAGAGSAQQDADAYRAALFFAALEDLAGRDHFAEAFRRFWRDMADQHLAVGELRSALEAVTGSDLASMFDAWLNRPGIPDAFRQRYGARAQAANGAN